MKTLNPCDFVKTKNQLLHIFICTNCKKPLKMIVPVPLKEVTFFQSYMSISTFLRWPENRRVYKKYNQVNQVFDPTFLNSLLPNVPYWSPWKPPKTYGFLIFSGGDQKGTFCFLMFSEGIKRGHWEEKD